VLTEILKRYLSPYKFQVFLSLFLLLAQAVANLYLPSLNAELINKGVAQGKIDYIIHIGWIMLLASTVVILVSILAGIFIRQNFNGIWQRFTCRYL
jgi:ATP-binding cassette subfamily B protein